MFPRVQHNADESPLLDDVVPVPITFGEVHLRRSVVQISGPDEILRRPVTADFRVGIGPARRTGELVQRRSIILFRGQRQPIPAPFAAVILSGTVVSIKEFGAFIEFAPGKEGMVHISKIAKHRINHVEDVLTLGDRVTVVCLGKDKMGRLSFSMKDVKQGPYQSA